MQVQLIVTNKSQNGQAIPVNVPAFRIGQAEDCHLRSQSSRISPHHCIIYTHEGTVTIQDLGGETGTFVNGNRIASPVTLKDGDGLVVGKHSFTLSIKSEEVHPVASQHGVIELANSPEPEQEAEIMFEVRHKGQNVSVTQARLFEMARKGMVLPDDIIVVAGTKVFADSVRGIVFGKESSDVASPSYAVPSASSPTYAPVQSSASGTKKGESATPVSHGSAGPPEISASANELSPFDIANEPLVQVTRVPGARKEVKFSDLGKSLEEPLEQASTWLGSNISKRHVAISSSVLVTLCLLGGLVYLLLPLDWKLGKSSYGAVYIVGELTLNGSPIEEVAVVLHPRDGKEDHKATGRTDKRGRFTVTTGADPDGRGAVPGEYNVTFRKKGEVPPEYEKPETSGQSITIEPAGKTNFSFELTSSTPSPRPTSESGTGFTSPPQVPGAGLGTGTVPPTAPPPPNPAPQSVTSYQSSLPNIWAAATKGTVEDIEFFVNRDNVSFNAMDNASNTLLHLAAASNAKEEVIKFLISRGASINAGNRNGDTPLHNAARSNPDVKILSTLIALGANIHARNNIGETPLDVATEQKKQALIDAGAVSGIQPTRASAPPPPPPRRVFGDIFEAAEMGTASDVQSFLAGGGDVNQANEDGRTPLHLAARHNSDAEVIRFLLTRGSDVNARCKSDWSPLHEAAYGNANVAVLQVLVERGRADVNVIIPETKRTPLHNAAQNNRNVDVLRYLLSCPGISINMRDSSNDTPLHLAARFNSEEILRLLVTQRGIEVNVRNRGGETAWDCADTEAKKNILHDAGGHSGKQ